MVASPPAPVTGRVPPGLIPRAVAKLVSSTVMPAPLSSSSLTGRPLIIAGMKISPSSKNSKSIQPVDCWPDEKLAIRGVLGQIKRAGGVHIDLDGGKIPVLIVGPVAAGFLLLEWHPN